METKKQYNGLDVTKFILALLVAQRHIIQIFFEADSRWRILIGNWLSNLAVPVFFITAGFFLFRKVEAQKAEIREMEVRKAGTRKAAISGSEIQASGAMPSRAVRRGSRIVYQYCLRILRMYVIWSILYLPVDLRNWYYGTRDVKEGVLSYLQSFFFCSTIPQLWYLPALGLACLLVWLAYSKGMKVWQILAVGFCLLLMGYLTDNWYYNRRFPEAVKQVVALYRRYFITPRNGIFYGCFYVAVGLAFARMKRRIPFLPAAAGFCFFLWCMYREVMRCTDAGSNTNFMIFAAPAAVCLFAAAAAVDWKDRPLYRRLRGMSEWIYLSHFYFFQFLVWLRPWNPVPFTGTTVTVMIMVPMLVCCWGLVRLSETRQGAWLKMLI